MNTERLKRLRLIAKAKRQLIREEKEELKEINEEIKKLTTKKGGGGSEVPDEQ